MIFAIKSVSYNSKGVIVIKFNIIIHMLIRNSRIVLSSSRDPQK